MEEKLKALLRLNQKKKGGKGELFNFLNDQIAKHTIEIRVLKLKNDPHLLKEVADTYLLSYMLLLNENVEKEIIDERIKKIEWKINNSDD